MAKRIEKLELTVLAANRAQDHENNGKTKKGDNASNKGRIQSSASPRNACKWAANNITKTVKILRIRYCELVDQSVRYATGKNEGQGQQ